MKLIRSVWTRYIRWCDVMGLTPESRRCCAPHLSDPQLQFAKQNKFTAWLSSVELESSRESNAK